MCVAILAAIFVLALSTQLNIKTPNEGANWTDRPHFWGGFSRSSALSPSLSTTFCPILWLCSRTKICIQQHEENIDKCPPLNAINNLNYVAKPNFIANTNSDNKNSMAKQMASLLKYMYAYVCVCAYICLHRT